MRERPSLLRRVLVALAHFGWDFFVGDTPEIFGAVVLTVLVTLGLGRASSTAHLAAVVLPTMVVLALALSVRRAGTKRK